MPGVYWDFFPRSTLLCNRFGKYGISVLWHFANIEGIKWNELSSSTASISIIFCLFGCIAHRQRIFLEDVRLEQKLTSIKRGNFCMLAWDIFGSSVHACGCLFISYLFLYLEPGDASGSACNKNITLIYLLVYSF